MERRNTLQKELVYSAVRALGCHATADEIYNRVNSEYPSVSRATVYRNLNVLSEEGRILRVEVPGGADHFDHNTHNHYHISCVECGRVYDADMEYIPDMVSRIRDTKGFKILGSDVVFKGICPECQQKNNQEH